MKLLFSGKVLVVVLIMAAFYLVDQALAGLERQETRREAEGLYRDGTALINANQPGEAILKLQRAYSIERTNRKYELTLADAEFKAGRKDDARTTLENLLDADSNDGAANLLMARLNVSEGKWKQADQYYHRAIFGTWVDQQDTAAQAVNARLELAKLLADRGDNQELLSELLVLEEETRAKPELARQVAALMLKAGSAGRAEEIYKAQVRSNSGDTDARAGLGEAELQLGNYRAAERDFAASGRQDRYQVAQKLADLDPTSRRLAEAEKDRRSAEVLRLTRDAVASCVKPQSGPSELQVLLDLAGKLPATGDYAENRLEVASRLWKIRPAGCDGPPDTQELLRLLHARMLP